MPGKSHVRRLPGQRGIALLLVVLVLLLLSGVGLVLMSETDSETKVNLNYHDAQQAYFAARAGIEEVRARIAAGDALVIPTAMPSATNNQVIYVTNPRSASEVIAPWSASNAYVDTEICQENYAISGMTNPGTTLVPCGSSNLPSVATWYKTTPSTGLYTGASGALSYKWVRVTLKANGSSPNLVDSTGAASSQVCWDSTNTVQTLTCTSNQPVYMITALAVTPAGSRRMVQYEMAYSTGSPYPFQYAMFSTYNGCNSLVMSGGIYTDSFDSTPASGSSTATTYASSKSTTSGSIASLGNVNLSGSVTINGNINLANTNIGYANHGAVCSGSGSTLNYGITSSTGSGSCVPWYTGVPAGPCPVQAISTSAPTVPAAPTLTQDSKVITYDWRNPNVTLTPAQVAALANTAGYAPNMDINNYQTTLSGGTYNLYNVTVEGSGTLTLGPGTYNINSLNLTGGGTINISMGSCTYNPANVSSCAVILNVAGNNNSTPVSMSGGTFANNTLMAPMFQINYGGSGNVNIVAGTAAYMGVLAPNANVTLSGNGQIYGAIVGSKINDGGSATVHYDKQLSKVLPSGGGGGVVLISFHEMMY
jgi:hypothetical protein